jgi:fibronectin type 3 domain-containing protein
MNYRALSIVLLLSSLGFAQAGIPANQTRVAEKSVQIPKDKPGSPQVAHSATLTWSASTSPNILNYPVYRSLTTGGPYTQVAAVPITPPLTYTDLTVLAGTTYFYVVTAKDANLESNNSNQATAVIPPDPVKPNPPTNLTVVAQ